MYAVSVAVAGVRVSVAVAVVDPVTAVLKVVVPHPLTVTLASEPSVNVGNTSANEWPVCTSGTFSANVNEMAVGADVDGVEMVRTLC